MDKLRISLGEFSLMESGQPLSFDRDEASNYLKKAGEVHGTVTIDLTVGEGAATGKAWGLILAMTMSRSMLSIPPETEAQFHDCLFQAGDSIPEVLANATQVQGDYMPIVRKGSATSGTQGHNDSQFLDLLRLSGDGQEINRGTTLWRKKPSR
ncbi:hypothetical protein Bca4012_009152 [Brassica carinata]|uniref:Uncharacterized protein n=1 Tax=Brassica carinata TaxID=52824 RepID=A0A8X7V0S3_BRACI|nr:hypothetical protein Bca52824_034434 [Brassica carinata]